MTSGSELMSVAAQASDDALKPLYYLIGSQILITLIGSAVGVVRWLAKRTVDREDEDKKKLEVAQDELRGNIKEHDEALNTISATLARIQGTLESSTETLNATKSLVADVKRGVEDRLEKQSEFYQKALEKQAAEMKEKLEQLEFKLRGETTRALGDLLRSTKKGSR